jgi:epoxyqueuosine reductase
MENLNQLLKIQEKLIKLGATDSSYTENPKPLSYSHYQNWLENNQHGPLKYLSDERSLKRESLTNVFSDFQSAITFLFQYPKRKTVESDSEASIGEKKLKVASFIQAFDGGEDYHKVIGAQLKELGEFLKNQIFNQEENPFEYIISLDVLPILERDLAYRSGLGWIGKNSMLIHTKLGSYTFIASLLTNRKFKLEELNFILGPKIWKNTTLAKVVELDHCGTCRKCLDACPTSAINEVTRTINAQLCISTFTLEEFKSTAVMPKGYEEAGWVLGCDICQEVCPWNNKLISYELNPTIEENFFPLNVNAHIALTEIKKLSNKQFKRKYFSTILGRLGKNGLMKNLMNLKKYF